MNNTGIDDVKSQKKSEKKQKEIKSKKRKREKEQKATDHGERQKKKRKEKKQVDECNSSKFLKGYVFCVTTKGNNELDDKTFEDTYAKLKEEITKAGGSVCGIVHKKVTALVSTHRAIERKTQRVRKALKFGVPIVDIKFLEACMKKKKLVRTKRYELKVTIDEKKEKEKKKKNNKSETKKKEPVRVVDLGCCCSCHDEGKEEFFGGTMAPFMLSLIDKDGRTSMVQTTNGVEWKYVERMLKGFEKFVVKSRGSKDMLYEGVYEVGHCYRVHYVFVQDSIWIVCGSFSMDPIWDANAVIGHCIDFLLGMCGGKINLKLVEKRYKDIYLALLRILVTKCDGIELIKTIPQLLPTSSSLFPSSSSSSSPAAKSGLYVATSNLLHKREGKFLFKEEFDDESKEMQGLSQLDGNSSVPTMFSFSNVFDQAQLVGTSKKVSKKRKDIRKKQRAIEQNVLDDIFEKDFGDDFDFGDDISPQEQELAAPTTQTTTTTTTATLFQHKRNNQPAEVQSWDPFSQGKGADDWDPFQKEETDLFGKTDVQNNNNIPRSKITIREQVILQVSTLNELKQCMCRGKVYVSFFEPILLSKQPEEQNKLETVSLTLFENVNRDPNLLKQKANPQYAVLENDHSLNCNLVPSKDEANVALFWLDPNWKMDQSHNMIHVSVVGTVNELNKMSILVALEFSMEDVRIDNVQLKTTFSHPSLLVCPSILDCTFQQFEDQRTKYFQETKEFHWCFDNVDSKVLLVGQATVSTNSPFPEDLLGKQIRFGSNLRFTVQSTKPKSFALEIDSAKNCSYYTESKIFVNVK